MTSLFTKPAAKAAAPIRCALCNDGGLIQRADKPKPEVFGQVFDCMLPCTCEAGDVWRKEFGYREFPPMCACGLLAVYGFESTPRCEKCEHAAIVAAREARRLK